MSTLARRTYVPESNTWYEIGDTPTPIDACRIPNTEAWANGLEYGGRTDCPTLLGTGGTGGGGITAETDPVASAAVSTEAATRAADDAALAAQIAANDGELADHETRIAALEAAPAGPETDPVAVPLVTAEETARIAADAALDTRIAALEAVDHSQTQDTDNVPATHTPVNYTGGAMATDHLAGIDAKLGQLEAVQAVEVVADIAARDALAADAGMLAHVADASADPTVDSGYAKYLYDGAAWVKVAEGESLDLVDFVGTDGTTPGAAGFVPAPGVFDVDRFLRGDGSWESIDLPTPFTGAEGIGGDDGSDGLVPAPVAGEDQSFLRGDGTWAIPASGTTLHIVNNFTERAALSAQPGDSVFVRQLGAFQTTPNGTSWVTGSAYNAFAVSAEQVIDDLASAVIDGTYARHKVRSATQAAVNVSNGGHIDGSTVVLELVNDAAFDVDFNLDASWKADGAAMGTVTVPAGEIRVLPFLSDGSARNLIGILPTTGGGGALFQGSTPTANGVEGLVPAPDSTFETAYYLRADGGWAIPGLIEHFIEATDISPATPGDPTATEAFFHLAANATSPEERRNRIITYNGTDSLTYEPTHVWLVGPDLSLVEVKAPTAGSTPISVTKVDFVIGDWNDNGDGTYSLLIPQGTHGIPFGRRAAGISVYNTADYRISADFQHQGGGAINIFVNSLTNLNSGSVEIIGAAA